MARSTKLRKTAARASELDIVTVDMARMSDVDRRILDVLSPIYGFKHDGDMIDLPKSTVSVSPTECVLIKYAVRSERNYGSVSIVAVYSKALAIIDDEMFLEFLSDQNSSGVRTVLGEGIHEAIVVGVHVVLPNQIPANVIVRNPGTIDQIVGVFRPSGNFTIFITRHDSPIDDTEKGQILLRKLQLEELSDSSYGAATWVEIHSESISREIASLKKKSERLKADMQKTLLSLSNKRAVYEMLRAGTNVLMNKMVGDLEKADYRNVRLTSVGILGETGPLEIDHGEYDTSNNARYLGNFQILITYKGSILFRNLESSTARSHPYWTRNLLCFGEYADNFFNCLQSVDYLTLGLAIKACLCHFDSSRAAIVKSVSKSKCRREIQQWTLMYGTDNKFGGLGGDDDD